MNYKEVLKYLEKASQKGSVLGLERIEKLLELLSAPQDKLKIIHVSGTNGKGSFSAMLSSVLKESGYKVGVFSSPSLVTVNDSFRINCEIVSDTLFAEILSEVIYKAEEMDDKPTEFELLTAAAFLMFYKTECEICIIECGLGGDTDSTNVVKNPILSVITNVQKDHCTILGDTLSEIATHKAGIIKSGSPVFYGGEKNEAYDVIRGYAQKTGSDFYCPGSQKPENERYGINGTFFDYGRYRNIKLSLLGNYQICNAVNVIETVEILRKSGVEISDSSMYKGFEKSIWQGRFEIVSDNPYIIFDGAHNPCGMEEAVKTIKNCFGKCKTAMLMGVMADKEYNLYPDMIRDIVDVVFTVTPDNPRALEAKKLSESLINNGIDARPYDRFEDGMKDAVNYVRTKKIPLIVLGSLYMYKEFSCFLSEI